MNRLSGLTGCAVLVSATLALAGCGNGGSKFVGMWDCGHDTTITISHTGGDKYAMDVNGHKGIGIYKDDALVNPAASGDKATLDQKTGDLIINESGTSVTCRKK